MNSRLRVLLIGRHFWPHGSIDSAGHLIQLASGLKRHGVHVEILTPRYSAAWTKEFCFREMRVHRPMVAPRSDWSVGRYTRQVTNWLRENGKSFDVLLADAAREESIATIDAARSLSCRSVVCIAGSGTTSDLTWWETSRAARRCAGFAKTADQVVVSGAESQRGLLCQGFAPSRICRIDVGFDGSVSSSDAKRSESRRALTAINSDFHAPPGEQVAVCVTSMQRSCGVQILVESARHLVARYPDLHFWFVGDGPQRDAIYNTLRGDGIRMYIAMPGSFGNMEDVFSAADLYVQTDDHGLQSLLPNAVSWGLPIVAVENPSTREVLRCPVIAQHKISPGSLSAAAPTKPDVETGSLVHWYQSTSPKSFRKAFRSVLDDLPASQEQAFSLRRELVRSRSQDQMIGDYIALLERLQRERLGGPRGRSIGAVS